MHAPPAESDGGESALGPLSDYMYRSSFYIMTAHSHSLSPISPACPQCPPSLLVWDIIIIVV